MTDDNANPDDRTVAALTDVMTVLDSIAQGADAPDLYLVVSGSGSAYLVDTAEGRCECPDDTHRPVECKHRRRVAFAIGERPILEWVNPAALDDQFGLHVNADRRRAVADGGDVRTPSDESKGTGSASGPLAVEADDDPRTKRAKREDIDVSFLTKPGRYEVYSASGRIYEVDVIEKTCSCPDDAARCKHLRRVEIEIRAGLVPRPDGRLPDA
ncbi:SWIM zinc finger family protein [Halomicroarcula sp. F13]|uniref:SWIM zinc finger family protein n=1 Tax=Haloarcula rubra TaxID=2487747 RepID=A0AAW4PX27_9EURY|nr:SWIM zinc finger family protein [Halomicroarcula rubra]MBX0325593.1 SWIM zinc finger family protein [Halomicroarcula rubra]